MWGAADFGGGLLSRRYPAVAVVAWSQLAGLLCLGGVAVVTGALAGERGWLPWAVVAAISGGLGLLAFYQALAIGRMGVVSPITALGGIVPVIAGLAVGERPSTAQYAGMVLALAGAVAASGPELSAVAQEADGNAGPHAGRRSVALAAVAGALFGFALVAIDGGAEHSPLMTLVGMRAVSVLCFAVVALALRTTGGIRAGSLPAVAVVGLADAGANLTFGVASTMGMVSIVSVLAGLYPVSTVVLALIFLGERLLPIQRVGVSIALVGIALLAAG